MSRSPPLSMSLCRRPSFSYYVRYATSLVCRSCSSRTTLAWSQASPTELSSSNAVRSSKKAPSSRCSRPRLTATHVNSSTPFRPSGKLTPLHQSALHRHRYRRTRTNTHERGEPCLKLGPSHCCEQPSRRRSCLGQPRGFRALPPSGSELPGAVAPGRMHIPEHQRWLRHRDVMGTDARIHRALSAVARYPPG